MPESTTTPRPPGDPIYTLEPTSPHTHTIILLHGLGSTGQKFGSELLETGITSSGHTLPQLFPGARFIFPTSKKRRSSAFGRSMLTQWFDLASLQEPELKKERQLKGLEESSVEVMAILEEELKTVPAENIILGGLSQGCAMSLAVLFCLEHSLAGFVGMSGYLTFQTDLQEAIREEEEEERDDIFATSEEPGEELQPSVRAQSFERDLLGMKPLEDPREENTACKTPVFLGHGVQDEKKPIKLGIAAAQTIRDAGYEVEWRTYEELGHWYKVPDEIDDIVDFITTKAGWSAALV